MANNQGGEKRVIGLYGEMRLAMELHRKRWEVYRAYIDDRFDFVIMKCYCDVCKDFRQPLQRNSQYGNSSRKVVTNLCAECKSDSIRMIVRFIQVKTSEGAVKNNRDNELTYSFHPKIRYHLADERVFYVWIQVWDEDSSRSEDTVQVNYFIFKTDEVSKFDNISLASYQKTDNQKLNLRLDKDGNVLNARSKYNISKHFKRYRNDFDILDQIIKGYD